MRKEELVRVDVIGFNCYPRTLEEAIKDYSLTDKEIKSLKQTGEILLFDGEVTLTLL